MTIPLRALDPAHSVGIGSRVEFPADDAAEIVGDDVVEANALAFAVNAIEQLNQFNGLDFEACLLDASARRPLSSLRVYEYAL